MRSRYARGAVEVRSWCGRSTLVVRSKYARGVVEVRSWSSQSTLVRFRYAHRCGSAAVLHFNFLSGGSVIVGGASEFIRILNRGSDNRGYTVYIKKIVVP